jgi:hypothetical protein
VNLTQKLGICCSNCEDSIGAGDVRAIFIDGLPKIYGCSHCIDQVIKDRAPLHSVVRVMGNDYNTGKTLFWEVHNGEV